MRSMILDLATAVGRAKLELVEVGMPVAVKTPVGIVLVLELFPPFILEEELVPDAGGGLTIALEGGAVGLPATLLTLLAGVDQLAD